jgi:hypothetical protein
MARSLSGVPLHRQGHPKIISTRFAEMIFGTHPNPKFRDSGDGNASGDLGKRYARLVGVLATRGYPARPSGRPLMINSVSRRGHRQILLATFSRPKTTFPQLTSPFQATRRRNLGLMGVGACTPSGQRPRARRQPARTGRGPPPASCGQSWVTSARRSRLASVKLPSCRLSPWARTFIMRASGSMFRGHRRTPEPPVRRGPAGRRWGLTRERADRGNAGQVGRYFRVFL